MIDMGAEHSRYVFIFLKRCLYGLGLKGERWVGMRTVLPVTHPDKHIHLQSFLPDHEGSYPIFPALMGHRKPQNCSDLQRSMKNPGAYRSHRFFWETRTSPALLQLGWPFANRDLTSLPSPWGASPVYRMQLLDALIFSSLWACELPPITSVYIETEEIIYCYLFIFHLFMGFIYLCLYIFMYFAYSWLWAIKIGATSSINLQNKR